MHLFRVFLQIAINTKALTHEKVSEALHVLAVLVICVRVKLRPRFDQIFPEYLDSRGKFDSETGECSFVVENSCERLL